MIRTIELLKGLRGPSSVRCAMARYYPEIGEDAARDYALTL